MEIALNTDFVRGTGSAKPYLCAMADAGFTHVHWCHQWNTDFLYSRHEVAEIKAWFRECGLKLLDIHGSQGAEKCWNSTVEYQRKAGVELVVNRLEMMDEMEATGSLMMHAPYLYVGISEADALAVRRAHEALRRSLDELLPVLEKFHRAIAIENIFSDTFELIGNVMRDYPAEYFGITYDSGHGNVNECQGMERLEPYKERLYALHLHDNDGKTDLHQPPFYGTVDWKRLAKLIQASHYSETGRPLSFELSMRYTPFFEEKAGSDQTPEAIADFLCDAYERCAKVLALY